ncbi:putative polyketide synthase protein [Hypoxylon sp. FL1150]|nr:putative polyketide synthase protein [Hypoxylon sp. FL1150]
MGRLYCNLIRPWVGALLKVKIALTGTPETTLVPLIAKSLDAKHPKSPLRDSWAKSVLEKLDHDTSKYLIGDQERVTYPQRARYFDNGTAEFLVEHPRATVLFLACGLNSRCLRLDWAAAGVRWIDIALPDDVGLWRKLLPSPKGDYSLVGADVTENRWLEQIPTDRSTVIVFEGSSGYLEKAVAHQGLDNPVELESLDARLQLRDCLRLVELEGFRDYPLLFRLVPFGYSCLPWFQNVSSCLRFDF